MKKRKWSVLILAAAAVLVNVLLCTGEAMAFENGQTQNAWKVLYYKDADGLPTGETMMSTAEMFAGLYEDAAGNRENWYLQMNVDAAGVFFG